MIRAASMARPATSQPHGVSLLLSAAGVEEADGIGTGGAAAADVDGVAGSLETAGLVGCTE